MFVENLKMALSALVANKMRSFLTMLGIIIGIGSVIGIASIGDTVRQMVSTIYQNVGATQSIVYLNIQDEAGIRDTDFFTNEEIEKYKKIFGTDLAYVDTNSSLTSEVKTKLGINKVTLTGVDSNFLNFQPTMEIKYGRFLTSKDIESRRYVVVVEDTAALKLFGKEDVVGKTFREKFNGALQEFTVIGVYHENMSPLQKVFMGNSQDLKTYVPTSLFIESEYNMFSGLRIFANKNFSGETLKRFNENFVEYVARNKGRNKEDFYLYSAGNEMAQVDGFLGAISIAMGGIAAISLIVGGIGIMNIMLVSVTERTREIGTRKALGATTRDILTQFLIESAVLSAIGGIIGTSIASGAILIAGAIMQQSVVIRPIIVILAVGFSALVGIFFGIYPALKAAKRDPIIALRYE